MFIPWSSMSDGAGVYIMEPNETSQEQYWDKVIDPQNLSEEEEIPINLLVEMEYYLTPAQQFAYDMMGDPDDKQILEIGCGMGINAIILAEQGANVTALDLSSKRLEMVEDIIRENEIQRIRLVHGSAEALPFPDNSFDIVYSNAVMIHLDKQTAIREFYRVLKPGGKVILVEPMKYHPLVKIYRAVFAPKIWQDIAEYITFGDLHRFGEQFQACGHKEFFLLSFIAFYWEFYLRDLVKFKQALKILTPMDAFLCNVCPPVARLAWFTVFWGLKK